MAIITTKQRDILAGFVADESDSQLSLKLPDGSSTQISKTDIATRQTAPSTMPEIYASGLSRTDMRDLIAFLGTLIVEPEKRHDDIEEY